MPDWLEQKAESTSLDIRDVLFGDVPLSGWVGQNQLDPGEPWLWFANARRYLTSGDKQRAIGELKKVTEASGLESRHYVQAWHFLRELGVAPPTAKAKEVHGVVVEYTLEQGLDIVAAYADHTARYFNYSGAAVIWDKPDDSLNGAIDDMLGAGRSIIDNIGPWEGTRPPPPPRGQARVSMLTPSGLHFGQAPIEILAKDEMGGPIIAAAVSLMKTLIWKSQQASA